MACGPYYRVQWAMGPVNGPRGPLTLADPVNGPRGPLTAVRGRSLEGPTQSRPEGWSPEQAQARRPNKACWPL